jgi:hypothetical protein
VNRLDGAGTVGTATDNPKRPDTSDRFMAMTSPILSPNSTVAAVRGEPRAGIGDSGRQEEFLAGMRRLRGVVGQSVGKTKNSVALTDWPSRGHLRFSGPLTSKSPRAVDPGRRSDVSRGFCVYMPVQVPAIVL